MTKVPQHPIARVATVPAAAPATAPATIPVTLPATLQLQPLRQLLRQLIIPATHEQCWCECTPSATVPATVTATAPATAPAAAPVTALATLVVPLLPHDIGNNHSPPGECPDSLRPASFESFGVDGDVVARLVTFFFNAFNRKGETNSFKRYFMTTRSVPAKDLGRAAIFGVPEPHGIRPIPEPKSRAKKRGGEP